MGVLEAILLGAVQGLTEFLPVSSSGHLQIAKEMLGVSLADNLTFDVMLHVATVLATIVVLWREVAGLFKGSFEGLFHWRRNPQTDYVLKIALSMVPVAIVGLALKEQLNAMLSSPRILLIVGAMLLVTAALLAFASRMGKKQLAGRMEGDGAENDGAPGHARQKTGISYRDALVMGVAQAAAAMPGLSRSGSTIATGLLLGNRKAAVAQFSFLMVIPPILGEALLDVARGDFSGGMGIGALPLAAGFAAAFAVGCAACKFMIEMVKRSKLSWFAVYCAAAGVATIVCYFA